MPKPIINRTAKQQPAPANPWERAYQLLAPHVLPALARVPTDEFTTRQFIIYLRAVDEAEDAYQLACSGWKDNLLLGRQTVHGQVVPQLLRDIARAEWFGYVYDQPEEEDGLSVPAMWVKSSAM